MAPPRGLQVDGRVISALISLLISLLISILVGAAPLAGQSGPWDYFQPSTTPLSRYRTPPSPGEHPSEPRQWIIGTVTTANPTPSHPPVFESDTPISPLGPSSRDVRKSIKNGQRALALSESAGDKVAQVVNHAELARFFAQEGDSEQALVHISAAETMSKTVGDPRLQVNLLQAKGAAYMASGEFEKSLDAYREAMPILRYLSDEAGQADFYASAGWAFQSLGDIPRALDCYDSAVILFVKYGNADGEVRTRLAMGSLYQSISETEKADHEYETAMPKASSLDQIARILVSVAEILQVRNEPQSALIRYRTALALAQGSGDFMLEASILTGMGHAHMASRSYQEAQSDFAQARTRARESGNQAAEAGVLASMGELNYWIAIGSPEKNPKVHFSEALRDYNEALPLMQSAGDSVGEIGVLTNTALVYDAWGKSVDALSYYTKALQRMEELTTAARLEEFRLNLAGQAASLYQRAILLEARLHHMPEAFDLSERARARTFLDQLGNHRIDLGGHQSLDFSIREEKFRRDNIALERQLGQELAKPGPDVNAERTHAIQSRLSAVRTEYADLVSQLKLSNPGYFSFLSVSPLTLAEAQQQLNPDVTVLSYYTSPEMTLAFVLTRDNFHVTKLVVAQNELDMNVATFRDFAGQNDDPTTLKLLYKRLIAPFRSQLKTNKLAIVPYGVLHDLPFAALTPDGKQYLSDSFAITYLPSVSVLPYLHARMKPSGSQALVLANDQEEGLPRLSYAEGEARAVASLLGVQPLLGGDATTSVLRTSAGNNDVVHLIAHFDFDSQNPQSSRIILGHGKGNDGPLELNDVFGLDLRKTNLVVLSGCQSQRGERTRGDDVIGLSRAFIYAGSSSVLASLWSVDDDATQQLMIAFYTHLREGLSKAEALRTAQADIRRTYPNPFYWAGFVLTGDPGEVGTSSSRAISTN